MDSSGGGARSVGAWWGRVGLLALVGAVAPIAIAAHFGAFGIARNDDWAYLLAAFRFAESGAVSATHQGSMNLVGQLVAAFPVVEVWGQSIRGLQLEVAALGLVALVAIDDLASSVLSSRRALFVALMVAVAPMWASLSVSFMTDIPALACAMVCLALGVRAVRGEALHGGLFVAAVAVGFAGFAIREYVLVAPLSVCVVAWWSSSGRAPRRQPFVVAVLLGLVAAAGVLLAWRWSLPGFVNRPLVLRRSLVQDALHMLAESAVLLGLLVAPAVALSGVGRIVGAARRRAPIAVGVVAVCTLVGLGSEVVKRWSASAILGPGGYVMPQGILETSTAVGHPGDLIARPIARILAIVGVLSFTVVLLVAVPPVERALGRVRRRDVRPPTSPALAMIAVAATGYAAACVLPTLLGYLMYDRYLLPLIPLTSVLVLAVPLGPVGAARARRVAGGAALAALATLGFVYAANSASFDGTKWRVAETAAAAAGGVDRVEGGFEWTSFHAGGPVWHHGTYRRRDGVCIALDVTSSEPHGPAVVRAEPVWGVGGSDSWIVATRRHGC